MSSPRYVMIGGFLGAGKSTAIGRFARHLDDRGLRVGLITNDQGEGLVDTRRESQTIYYSLAEGPADRVIRVLHEIYCETDR